MEHLGLYSFWLTLLLGGTILVGLFVILLLLKSKSLNISRLFLAIILFCLLFHLNTFLLFTTYVIKQQPHLFGISYPALFLLGPAFYFFVKSFNKESFILKKKDLLHLLPFLIILILQFPSYLKSSAIKLELINWYYAHLPSTDISLQDWLFANLFMILFFGYILFSLRFLKKTDNINQPFLKKISRVLLFLAVSYMFLQTGFLLTGVSAIIAEIVLASLLAITILIIGYWVVDIKTFLPVKINKYKTSPLSEKKLIAIENQLIMILKKEKLYLQPRLKIRDLATALNIPSHHISQVLNERMQVSFYDFINKYRIVEAKKMLCNGIVHKISIEAIGAECGFNNKTSFYRTFKKFTGTTPSTFMKQENVKD